MVTPIVALTGEEESDLTQFSRLLLLPDFEEHDLQILKAREVLVVGLGGLGTPVALYLAQAGLRRLCLVDPDTVGLSNLPRQVLYGPSDLGQPKAQVLADKLRQLAPDCHIEALATSANEDRLASWVAKADLVLDCTDQFATRQVINKVCLAQGTPLVSASALQWSGQLVVVDPAQPSAGCYACLFDPQRAPVEASCGAYGVFTTAVGAMGLLQANEALKILLGCRPAAGRLLLFDAKEPRLESLRFSARPGCPVCQPKAG